MKFFILALCLFYLSCGLSYGISSQIKKIASKYQLQTGKFFWPAEEKIVISNWADPTDEDYRIIQNYLSSDRPELKYTNLPGTIWREERLKKFKIIADGISPKFGILYLNNSPDDKRNCIVTYVSCKDVYIKHLNELINSLKTIGFNGHIIFRIGGWPDTEEGSLELFDVPYAFKIFSIMEAKRLGYKNCLWLDSCMRPLRKLDSIFEQIENKGIYFYEMIDAIEFPFDSHLKEYAAEALGITVREYRKMAHITTWAVGLDLTNEISLKLLYEWHQMAREKLGFLSVVPEMAPFCALVHKYKLVSCATPYYKPYFSPTPEKILLWNAER